MLRNYLKTAFKVFLRRKFFTFVSLFGISLTLLVLLVATAMIDHMLGPTPPESRQARLLGIHDLEFRGPNNDWSSEPGYLFLDRHVRPMAEMPEVERMTFFTVSGDVASYVGGSKVELHARRTDAAYWQVFDFDFLEGAPYTQEDDEAGRAVMVIDASTRREFFGDAPAVGRRLAVDGQDFRVVGVVADVSSIRPWSSADVWAPIGSAKSSAYRHELMGGFHALLLARDRADFPAIKAELQRRLADVEMPDPKRYDRIYAFADTTFERIARDLLDRAEDPNPAGRLRLVIVLGVLLFLLLPSVNLINLNVSRILERATEIGVRKAFGASVRTLVAQLVLENVVLTLLGGAIGLVLAVLVLRQLSDSALLPQAVFHLNLRVFGWGVLLTLVFGVLSGLYPAWRMSRLHPVEALRGRSSR